MIAHRDNLRRWAMSPFAFWCGLRIDCGDSVRPFGEAVEDWQKPMLRAVQRAALGVCGRDAEAVLRIWAEMPRGHGKTLLMALFVIWVLLFAPKMVQGFAAAGDATQAALIVDAIRRLVSLNPFLQDKLDVQRSRIVQTWEGMPGFGSELTVLTSDAPTTEGLVADFIVCDEVAEWRSRALFDTLASIASKRPNCAMVCITNAGSRQHWAWEAREAVRTSGVFEFLTLDGPKASWILPRLAELQALLTPSAYARRILNLWQDGRGDGLPAAAIERAIGPRQLRGVGPFKVEGVYRLIGCDLSLRSDHTAVVCVEVDAVAQQIRVARCLDFDPAAFAGELPLAVVEEAVEALYWELRASAVLLDVYQAASIAQRLGGRGVTTMLVTPNAAELGRQAAATLMALREGYLRLGDETPADRLLLSDLRSASLVERQGMPGVYRIVSERSKETGHGDRLSALALLLPCAVADLEAWRLGAAAAELPEYEIAYTL